MAGAGISTANIALEALLDEILGNRDGSTRRVAFDDFATQLADRIISVTYATARDVITSLEPTRGTGKIWETALGVRYKEAPPTATDQHVTTAGGVKLYVVRGPKGYDPRGFGVTMDGVTDDSAAWALANSALNNAGGDTLMMPPGTSLIGAALAWKPNVHIDSDFGSLAQIVASGSFGLFKPHGGSRAGDVIIRNVALIGYAGTSATQGMSIANIGPVNNLFYDGVKVRYAQFFGLSGDAVYAKASNCDVKYCLRDGINLSNAVRREFIANRISYCGDDGISAHVEPGAANPLLYSVTAIGNYLERCNGMKFLGARNAVVQGNSGRFLYGYGAYFGVDASEGATVKLGISVHDNVFLDILNKNIVSPGNTFGAAIYFDGIQSLGSGGSAISVVPGDFDPATGLAQPLMPFINQQGATLPRGRNFGISVRGNKVVQTIQTTAAQPIAKFSDTGFGPLWYTAGTIDPAMTTLIRNVDGIWFNNGDWAGVQVSENDFFGVQRYLYLYQFTAVRNFVVRGGSAIRCKGGVVIAKDGASSACDVDVLVDGVDFNLDPMWEAPNRNQTAGQVDGSWTQSGSDYAALSAPNVRGVVMRNCRIRNCMIDCTGTVQLLENNDIFYDWSTGTNLGVGVARAPAVTNNHFFEYSDPRGTAAPCGSHYSAVLDSAFLKSATAQPTDGYFRKGQFVANSSPALASGKVLAGWRRLTNSTSPGQHVANTDWAADYRYAS